MKLALRAQVPDRERWYADSRTTRQGNAPSATGSTCGASPRVTSAAGAMVEQRRYVLSRSARATAARGRAHAEFGLQAREPLADRVQAQEQLPRELGLVVDDGGRAQHLDLARGQAEAVEGVGAEARHGLLEQQCVRIAGQQADGEAPAFALADQRRARRQREPLGDRRAAATRDARPRRGARPASARRRGLESSISPSRSSSTTAVPGGGSSASARTRRPRACVARSAPSSPGRAMSSTSRSRSENSRSVRPSAATTASPRPVRMPIAISYSTPAACSRSP